MQPAGGGDKQPLAVADQVIEGALLGQLGGAVAVVSGNIAGQTQTLPLFIEDAYKQYDTELAYGAALILGGVGLVSLLLKLVVEQLMGGVKETEPMN